MDAKQHHDLIGSGKDHASDNGNGVHQSSNAIVDNIADCGNGRPQNRIAQGDNDHQGEGRGQEIGYCFGKYPSE